MRPLTARACVALAAAALASTASGETRRPWVTEDPDVLPSGRVELQVAAEVHGDHVSASQPLSGTLVRLPVVGVHVGLGDRAELQVRAPLWTRFDPDGAEPRTAVGDVTLGAKVRAIGGDESPFRLSGRFVVKLPNIDEETGIGTDETDVLLEALGGVRLGLVHAFASVGYAILGDPFEAASQNDKVVLGAVVAFPMGPVELGLDVHGVRWGDAAFADRSSVLAGVALDLGPVRLDGGAGVETTEGDQGLLATAGATVRLPF